MKPDMNNSHPSEEELPATLVAEVSCGYTDGRPLSPGLGPLAMRFESVIEYNANRGYRLRDWKLVSALAVVPESVKDYPKTMYTETIIAIFERIP